MLLAKVALRLFPEGGDLVEGLPGRVYFAATNPLGKPADVAGVVVDDRGARVASFSSLHDGMGRFALTPARDRAYHVEITRPTGIAERFPVPAAQTTGCALQSLDDFDSKRDELRVAAWCTSERSVVVEAVQRETRVASASAAVAPGAPTVIALALPRASQGIVRVTLLSEDLAPLAERLVYRGRGADLRVSLTAVKPKLAPRDPVELAVETRDAAGRPVEANLALAVVDDTVLSLADDKSGNLLAHLYLEKELGDAPIDEPNYYFGAKPDAAAALDLLVGTRGWRRFDWKLVLAPPAPTTPASGVAITAAPAGGLVLEGAIARPRGEREKERDHAPREPRPMKPAMRLADKPVDGLLRANRDVGAFGLDRRVGGGGLGRAEAMGGLALGRAMKAGGWGRLRVADDLDEDFGGEQVNLWAWAPVRQFPVPDYAKRTDGPRTDFRETIYWNPSVQTGKDGRARVRFYLSDAVTSFRATAEGSSLGGLPGRGEATLTSKLPLSLEAKLPLEVSSGDTIRLPLTIVNETDRAMEATLEAKFGAAFKLAEDPATAPLHLAAGERRTLFFPLEVVGLQGDGEVALAVTTDGLRDELKRTIRVVPVGFPQTASFSGVVKGAVEHTVDLGNALPRTVTASVKLYPSPLSTMIEGAEGMLQEPSGCFEQTSSTNYPNVMVSQYLAAHEVADPALIQKSHGLLDRGYKRLVGFESPKHGYEWFGGDPGHEALTAYGILEFTDMQKIYGDVDRTMIDRTAKWLYSRRDGKGGYLRNARALDSFGAAPPEVTDAYITWALTEAGKRDLPVEIEAQKKRAMETSDPYLVALAANTLLNAAPKDSLTVVSKLEAMQSKEGNFPGAKTTITRSGGQALEIETTSLAALALLKASPHGEHDAAARTAVEWLTKHDNGRGVYGSTQSTVLALRAINAYAEHARQTSSSGVATLVVNGKQAGRVAFEKGRRDAIVFDDVAGALVTGPNTVEIRVEGGAELPYAVAIDYRTREPRSSPEAKVGVTASLAKQTARMGETVRLHAVVENRAAEGQPMALARIGLPGGLTFQTWQLKELRDKGLVDFYETRQREVILYYRSLAPSAKREIDLALMAVTPGQYVAPASSAYLYYTNEHKTWAAPLSIAVAP